MEMILARWTRSVLISLGFLAEVLSGMDPPFVAPVEGVRPRWADGIAFETMACGYRACEGVFGAPPSWRIAPAGSGTSWQPWSTPNSVGRGGGTAHHAAIGCLRRSLDRGARHHPRPGRVRCGAGGGRMRMTGRSCLVLCASTDQRARVVTPADRRRRRH